MKRFLRTLCAGTALFAVLASHSQAHAQTTSSVSQIAAARTISYQGVLKNSDGSLAKNGKYAITVHLYSDENGMIEVWSDTYDASVLNGLFNLALGSGTSPLPEAGKMDKQLYLGIQIGEGEI